MYIPLQVVEKVEKYLEERGDKLDNWAYQWWLEDMYLDNMAPLPVNSSPGWVLPRRDFNGKQENMVKYLVGIINGLTEFKTQLERWVVFPRRLRQLQTTVF